MGLLVKDPGSLFAFWELPSSSREGLRRRHGDRAASLARVTLRVDEDGSVRHVIPPAGSHSHYLATESPGGSARVELGWTLPSGRFEVLAQSESVSVPRAAPSPDVARETLRFPEERSRARRLQAMQVRMVRRPPPRAVEAPVQAGGSDAFRPARGLPGDVAPGGGSDAFSPPGGPTRR